MKREADSWYVREHEFNCKSMAKAICMRLNGSGESALDGTRRKYTFRTAQQFQGLGGGKAKQVH